MRKRKEIKKERKIRIGEKETRRSGVGEENKGRRRGGGRRRVEGWRESVRGGRGKRGK